MEQIESNPLAEQIIAEITVQTKIYNEAIKNKKKISEVKEIRLRIRELVNELKALLSGNEN
jgi:hypothetical protein